MVAGVLLVVAYIGMIWEERKTRDVAGATHAVRGVLPETMALLMQYRCPAMWANQKTPLSEPSR